VLIVAGDRSTRDELSEIMRTQVKSINLIVKGSEEDWSRKVAAGKAVAEKFDPIMSLDTDKQKDFWG
jgi:hypothetical protein